MGSTRAAHVLRYTLRVTHPFPYCFAASAILRKGNKQLVQIGLPEISYLGQTETNEIWVGPQNSPRALHVMQSVSSRRRGS
jgi:hypothetical protein